MHQRLPSVRYDSVARTLHWVSAALIIVGFSIGLAIDVPPKDWYPLWLNTHVLIGLSVLALAVVRLAWRVNHPAPPPVPGASAPMAVAVRIGHGALYLAMILVPLIGFAPLFLRGRGISFGLFQIASPIAANRALVHTATDIHKYVAWALIALATGHFMAALWHHYVRRDETLLRMAPLRKS